VGVSLQEQPGGQDESAEDEKDPVPPRITAPASAGHHGFRGFGLFVRPYAWPCPGWADDAAAGAVDRAVVGVLPGECAPWLRAVALGVGRSSGRGVSGRAAIRP
jgi:hypothetical protein